MKHVKHREPLVKQHEPLVKHHETLKTFWNITKHWPFDEMISAPFAVTSVLERSSAIAVLVTWYNSADSRCVTEFLIMEIWYFFQTCKEPIMENWNQDHPERYSNFHGKFVKIQCCGKWPWSWWGPRKRQDHWPRPPGHRKWRKACINISKHIEVLKLCISTSANK